MSSNPKTCNICDDRHITKHATDWCSECEQAFCTECKEYHAFSRLSKNHITIPISDFLSLEPSFTNITSLCAEHNEIYQIFCQTHETLLCHNCLAEHDGCKGIVPLSEIIKNVKSSTNFEETQHGLTEINESITKTQDELKLSLEAINDEEKILMSDIDTMRKKIDDHLNQLETDLRKDLSKKATESRAAIEVSLQQIDDRKSEITKHLQQMKDLETYASEFQTYISLREKSSAVHSTESFVKSVAKDGNLEINTLSLNFDEKIQAIVSNINLFGIVQIQKRIKHVPLIRQKVKQAQLVGLSRPEIKSINDIKLKLVKIIDTMGTEMKGCEILSNGKMFFCTYVIGGSVLVFDSNGKHSFNVQMKPRGPCMDITNIDDNSRFAFSDGSDNHIHIVDISRSILKVHKSIPTKNSCFGIAYSDGSLFCCIYNEGIQKISLENYNVSTMVKFDLSIGYIAVLNNKLYYTDRNTNTVTCCTKEGQSLWTCTDDTFLKGPCGLSIDNNGFVYVVSSKMNSVIVLSPDGQDKRVLVTDSEGLKSPHVLQFDKLRNRLLVANNNSAVFLYDVLV